MTELKHVFNFYINGSIHVAIAVVCLTLLTYLEFDIEVDSDLLCFTFFATITGYNFVKYFGIAKFYHRSLTIWLKYIQLFSVFCFLGMLYYAFSLNRNALLVMCGLGVLTFLYAIPFFPKNFIKNKELNLRAISGLKIYVIALVWSLTVVVFPLVNSEYTLNSFVLITFIQRFLFVIVVMLPFEIRDMKFDSEKLLTIPQQIGVKRTKQMGVLLLVVFYLLEFLKDNFSINSLVVVSIVSLITLLFLVGSTINQRKYFSAFWVESIPIIWVVVYLILFR